MPCTQTLAGIERDCNPNAGGVSEVLLAIKDDIDSITVTNNVVTAITMKSGKCFYKYYQAPGVAHLDEEATIDQAAEARGITQTLYLQMNRMSTAKRIEFNALLVNELLGIVKDKNGLYWLAGSLDAPLLASAGASASGTAKSDANNYNVTLTADVSESHPEVSASIVDALLVPYVPPTPPDPEEH